MGNFYAQKPGSMYLIALNSNPPYQELITLGILTLLLTNHWGKLIRMPEGAKNIEYLHSNIQKGRSAKIAWKAYENIGISTPHCVRQRAGTLEISSADSCHQRPSQYWWNECMSAACRCPNSARLLTRLLTALTYTYLILRIFLWEIHIIIIMQ